MPHAQPRELGQPQRPFQKTKPAANLNEKPQYPIVFKADLNSQSGKQHPLVPKSTESQQSPPLGRVEDVQGSLEDTSTVPSHHPTQGSSGIDTGGANAKVLHNQGPMPSEDTITSRVTRKGATKTAPQDAPAPQQPRIVACVHCHAYWWSATCDNTEPCANCVATTTENSTHTCERPKCKNYDDPENCKQKEKCKRAHITDNYEHLANFKQNLTRRIVKREIPNYPSPASAVQPMENVEDTMENTTAVAGDGGDNATGINNDGGNAAVINNDGGKAAVINNDGVDD